MSILCKVMINIVRIVAIGVLEFISLIGGIILSIYNMIINFITIIIVFSVFICEDVQNLLFGNDLLYSIIVFTLFGGLYIAIKYIPIGILGLCESLKESLI